ncbi:MAG: hypothetical protein C3F13_11375 [Anaerolineales bacterium]|nr:MAG: hypothetical protein C3F13_11375 [Anaerolineales bacterium]
MSRKEFDTLESCISALEHGHPLDECIKTQPNISPETTELIELADRVRVLGQNQVSAEAIIRSREKLLARAAALGRLESIGGAEPQEDNFFQRFGKSISGFRSMHPAAGRLFIVLAGTLLLLIFSSGLVVTSAKSLPGEPLYHVKRAVEELEIYLIPGSENRHEFEDGFNQVRVVEVLQLLKLRQVQQISFEGMLEETSGDQWRISGIPVLIQDGTMFGEGMAGGNTFIPGSYVEVEGFTRSDGVVIANEIHLREYSFHGTVDQIGTNHWTIAGIGLATTEKTMIGEGIVVGDRVTAWVHSWDSGLYALSITKDDTPGSTPSKISPEQPDEWSGDDVPEEQSMEGTTDTYPIVTETTISSEQEDLDEASATPEPHEREDQPSQTVEPMPTEEEENGTASPENYQTPEPTDGHSVDP